MNYSYTNTRHITAWDKTSLKSNINKIIKPCARLSTVRG